MAKERQEEIIRAAAKRFSRHGFTKTTLDEIARDVRIGKPTIYHYFKSKDDLFYSSINFQSTQFIEDIKAIFNNQDLPVGARLLEYFAFKETVYHRYRLLYDLILTLFKDDTLEKEKQILNYLLQKESEVVGLILSSIYTGRIESMNPSLPFYIVHISWGLMFSNIIKEINSDGKAISMKELMFRSLETILS
ncbi:MAG: TetR/AcrR family transcriptional regulator [Ignavibacteriaceae bacterium]|nr:TetR/AcrR family transcriptional regulator [Ignavibacteriaceae bacterium]